jgi:hypothetical protein
VLPNRGLANHHVPSGVAAMDCASIDLSRVNREKCCDGNVTGIVVQ